MAPSTAAWARVHKKETARDPNDGMAGGMKAGS